MRDLPALVETMQKHKVDKVIHTAGLIGGKVAQPLYSGLQINVMGTINVAEAVRLTGVKRLVQISTMGIYDRRLEGDSPIEENFHRGPGEPYGNSKVAKELMVEAYQRLYGFELIIVRLANVYGVGHFAGGSGAAKWSRTCSKLELRAAWSRSTRSRPEILNIFITRIWAALSTRPPPSDYPRQPH